MAWVTDDPGHVEPVEGLGHRERGGFETVGGVGRVSGADSRYEPRVFGISFLPPRSPFGCRVPLEVAVRMALTLASPDRPMLSLAFVSQCRWRFVGNTAQPACVDDLLNALEGFLRRADNIISLSDYIHATGRATTRSPGRGSLR